ncbi:hypothetical protein BDV26DRAFT_289321 [Aspergillus bertholletiae]|uniref:Uncharacterized protein n=1 Tax=Aspergillus bertholletiae TaxID=1226010 RepID=A0A5N7BIV7_9EURO|nr:hypothetical protein BDV26DRAFT_289321 [Aspergillus bertholletiae]
MEALNPHSGGPPSASRWMPLSGVPPLPPLPTPIYRGGPRALDIPFDLDQISNSESSRAPSRASSRSSRSTRSAYSTRKRQGTGPALNPQSLRKLAESHENQEYKRQAEIRSIHAYIDQRIEAQTAQQRTQEQQYEAQIKALEEKVQELQQAQIPPTDSGPRTAKKAPYTELLQAPQAPQSRKAEFSTHGPQNRAASNKKSDRPESTYADITALLKTNPGGQGWQTVTTKRYQKTARTQAENLPQLKAAKRTPLEARRLIFRRENGLETPKAECEDIILGLNIALTKAGLPDFLRVVDAGYTCTGAISIIL